MSRMDQVIQIGKAEGDIYYYIEDYAYTYLKKQKGKEKSKYFLYGEMEEKEQQKKLYIYGIAEKPKMEQTYFKEYYPLGFLKIKEEEIFWITLKGQEYKMTGYFVFYAPNQAMQEYLVDHHEEMKEDKPEEKVQRQPQKDVLPITEIQIPARKVKINRKRKENENLTYSFGGILIAMLLVFFLTTANGQKKIEVFKEVIKETMLKNENKVTEETIVIEETRISSDTSVEEEESIEVVSQGTDVSKEKKEIITDLEETKDKEIIENIEMSEEKEITENIEASKEKELAENIKISEEKELAEVIETPEEKQLIENIEMLEEKSYDEYIVKEGDTLAAICNNKYASLSNMQEICVINNIKNPDYIAPGQKLYLPR